MDSLELMKSLSRPTPSKIVLLVIDGLGGLASPETGKTELETAHTPNLNHLVSNGVCGLIDTVGRGITPGSAPGHLALFGYDPVRYNVGRGVLEAVGIEFDLKPEDVAARGNFSTVDTSGRVTDRRAGRITTEKCAQLCQRLDGREIEGVNIIVRPVREHRFVAIFRGQGLTPEVTGSDPQQTGKAPLEIKALSPEAGRMADIAKQFVAQAGALLENEPTANMLLLRGFSRRPEMPTMAGIYQLKAAAIATYPMYRGLARLVGMDVLETGSGIEDIFETLARYYQDYDFFFLHAKWTDSAAEDGDFERKVKIIEQIDGALSRLIALNPDVIVVTGDHSTPAILSGHSWHPVPVLLHSRWCRPDGAREFAESACILGGLGRFPATRVMPLAMANALKLAKFGA